MRAGRLQQVQQLSRLTLAVDEAAVAAAALAPGAPLPAGYDIVAVQPLSERVLQQVSPCAGPARGLLSALCSPPHLALLTYLKCSLHHALRHCCMATSLSRCHAAL